MLPNARHSLYQRVSTRDALVGSLSRKDLSISRCSALILMQLNLNNKRGLERRTLAEVQWECAQGEKFLHKSNE